MQNKVNHDDIFCFHCGKKMEERSGRLSCIASGIELSTELSRRLHELLQQPPPRLHLMMSLGISGILCPRCQTPMSVIDMSAIERKCSKCFLLIEGPLVSTMIEKDAKGSMIYPRVEYFKLEV